MAKMTFAVSDYQAVLARQNTIGGGATKFYAQIVCRSAEGDRFVLFFLRPDGGDPPNSYLPAKKFATSYLPAEQFSWYLDILRNEKPVYAVLNSDNPITNGLSTGDEPVGEEEEGT